MSLRSPYPDVEIPDVSLTEFLFADGFGDRADAPAIVDGTTGDQLTYTEFHGLVEKIAGGSRPAASGRATSSRCSRPTCRSGRHCSTASCAPTGS